MKSVLFLIITVLALGFLYKPVAVFASPLQWVKSNGIGSYSQEVRIAPSNPSIVYATIRANGSGLFRSTDNGQNFNVVFPIVIGRDVNSIAISYSNPSKLCIGTYSEGVFCSTDGTNFSNSGWLNSNLQGLFTRFVAVDPNNDSVFFAGTGESNSDGGIYRSADSGNSWVKVGASTFGNRNCLNIVVDRLNSDRIFATADDGLFRSLDGGQNWVKFFLIANLPALIIDNSNSSILYSGSFGAGVVKSIDNGETWSLKNNGIESALAFRISQSATGEIYISKRNFPGGVFVTRNGGDIWEDVSDLSWEGANAWGLDTGGGKVIVSIENHGVYVAGTNPPLPTHKACQNNTCAIVDGTGSDSCQADADCALPTHKTCQNNACVVVDGIGSDTCQTNTDCVPPTHKACVNYACSVVDGLGIDTCQINQDCIPPGPNPVVVIPGFGGSWSYKGLVQKEPTTYADWQLFPKFTDYYYQPILSALRGAGLTDSGLNQNLFVFSYDYRKSIKDTATWLNDFLNEQVLSKNPGKKANIAAHSMGGLVARYCFEKTAGCAGKIDKIVTAGSPHQGSLEAYDFWEAGKIQEKDLLSRTAERLLLQIMGFPKINPKEIVQTYIPGTADLLPNFPYIFGKDYLTLLSGQNPTLPSLNPPGAEFLSRVTALSGNSLETPLLYFVKDPSWREKLFGWWVDGRPWKSNKDVGDSTVLKSSSEIPGGTNKYYNFTHADYFNNASSITDTLAVFGLTATTTTSVVQPTSALMAYSSPNVSVEIVDKNNKHVGLKRDNNHSLFDQNLPPGSYQVVVSGQTDSDFETTVLFVDLKSEPKVKTFTGKIKRGETRNFSFAIN